MTCYHCNNDKTCAQINSSYRADIPTNNTCSSVSTCGKTCYYGCSCKACSSINGNWVQGNTDTSCYKNYVQQSAVCRSDCYTRSSKTCEDLGYYSSNTSETDKYIYKATTVCGKTCYTRTLKTCSDYGYQDGSTCSNSCKKAKAVSPRSGLTCYICDQDKTCEDLGYVSSIPTNNTCSSTTVCGKTCYYNCSCKACSSISSSWVQGNSDTCYKNYTKQNAVCRNDCYTRTKKTQAEAHPGTGYLMSINYDTTCYKNGVKKNVCGYDYYSQHSCRTCAEIYGTGATTSPDSCYNYTTKTDCISCIGTCYANPTKKSVTEVAGVTLYSISNSTCQKGKGSYISVCGYEGYSSILNKSCEEIKGSGWSTTQPASTYIYDTYSVCNSYVGTCYKSVRLKTCSDYGYQDSNTCSNSCKQPTAVSPRSGLTCYHCTNNKSCSQLNSSWVQGNSNTTCYTYTKASTSCRSDCYIPTSKDCKTIFSSEAYSDYSWDTNMYTNAAGTPDTSKCGGKKCYKRTCKSCENITDGTYYTSASDSCYNYTQVGGTNECKKNCYTRTKKTCEQINSSYKSTIPANQKCSSTTVCGKTCYYNCSAKTCTDYDSNWQSSSSCTDYCKYSSKVMSSPISCYSCFQKTTWEQVFGTDGGTFSKTMNTTCQKAVTTWTTCGFTGYSSVTTKTCAEINSSYKDTYNSNCQTATTITTCQPYGRTCYKNISNKSCTTLKGTGWSTTKPQSCYNYDSYTTCSSYVGTCYKQGSVKSCSAQGLVACSSGGKNATTCGGQTCYSSCESFSEGYSGYSTGGSSHFCYSLNCSNYLSSTSCGKHFGSCRYNPTSQTIGYEEACCDCVASGSGCTLQKKSQYQ